MWFRVFHSKRPIYSLNYIEYFLLLKSPFWGKLEENMSYSVAQNTTFLTAASILQKIVSFVYFTFIARMIGVTNTGQYFFAISFTTIFAVVADFGLGPVLTREAAKYPENSEKYVNTILWTKVIFGMLTYLLVVGFVNVLRYAPTIKLLIYLSGITMFFDNLQASFYSVFRARKNLIYESVGIVASQCITLAIGTFALLNHWPLYWLILAYTIPSGLNVIYAGSFLRRVFNLHYRFVFDTGIFRVFLSLALPFALAGIISRLYSYADSILMSKMLGAEHLGWWSVPYKITFAFQFIPAALSASVYPVMSILSVSDASKVGWLFEKSWRYLFIIVFPLALGIGILARPLIIKIYGTGFLPSVPVLQILLIGLVFGYLSFITGALLNATNHQKVQTVLLAIALVFNVGLNLALIPLWGIIGAAIAAVLSNIILAIGGFYFARRFAIINGENIFRFANQAIWPALVMALIVYYLSLKINFIWAIPVGAIIYGGLLFLTGGLSLEMVREETRKIWKR